MSKIDIAKKAVNFTVSHTAGFTTARLIVANTPTNGGLYEKACVVIGGFVIGSFVGSKTAEYTDSVIDSISDAITDSTPEPTK